MKSYQKARLAKDRRYDGKFFIAVKTTKIYCRPICPAPPPKETNVTYYQTAIQAQEAGFRPCRRCRPESAPQSPAWLGTQAVLNKAIRKIQAGGLNQQSLQQFTNNLGISERYLRKLFQQYLGTSPQRYANHVRLMFAKHLLHNTQLPITDIAYSSGFNSIRRFNDAFIKGLKLTPSNMRKASENNSSSIKIHLDYSGHYNWSKMQDFLAQRQLSFESVGHNYYSRTFQFNPEQQLDLKVAGKFTTKHISKVRRFDIEIEISDIRFLMTVVAKIRQILDIDADLNLIESHLAQDPQFKPIIQKGLRLPACWDSFEAGVKAIMGQQVSVKAAYKHTQDIIDNLSQKHSQEFSLFPMPEDIIDADLSFLRMPNARKETLRNFAKWYISNGGENLESILEIKGIGPWTLEYIKLRNGEHSDAFPEKDLGVIKAMKKYKLTDTEQWSPWRSYATLQLWNSL